MTVTKTTFFVQFSHFFTGQAFTMLLGFISFPILTRLLSVEEYGMLTLVTNTIAIAVVFAKMGMSDGIIRYYEEYSEEPEKRLVFSSTIFVMAGISSVFIFSCYLLSLPLLYKGLQIQPDFRFCFVTMAASLLVQPISIANLNLLRCNGKTIFFNVLNFSEKLASIVLGLFFLLLVVKELYGFFVGIVVAQCLIGIVLLFWFFRNYQVSMPQVSFSLARQLVGFGLPLLCTELSYMMLTYADRYMILFFHGEQELGIYSVGYNLAMYVANILVFSISYAIMPLYVKIYTEKGKEETEKFISDCLYYLLVLIIPVCLGYSAVDKELFVLLASDKYIVAASFSPLIVVASVILGMNSLLNAGLYLHKKTQTILLIIIIGVVLNVLCNYLFLPRFHFMGAAVSTLAACLATSIFTILFSFKYIAVKVNWKILYHVGVSILMYYVLSHITFEPILLRLCGKILIGIIIISIGLVLFEKPLLVQIRNYLLQR